MSQTILRANESHIDQILELYRLVYGNHYPLAFSKDPKLMRSMLRSKNVLWFITIDHSSDRIIGTLLFRIDPALAISKMEGVVVHPDRRGEDIASNMIKRGLQQLLRDETVIDSVYTTTRTVALGPQRMCLRNGFIPIGILPNSRKLVEYETLTLMAIFRDGLLAKRCALKIPAKVVPLQRALNSTLGITKAIEYLPVSPISDMQKLNYEFITTPAEVMQCFMRVTSLDPTGAFYPFHTPNTLIVDRHHGIEIFAYICEEDKYCTIIYCSCPLAALGRGLGGLVQSLNEYGVSYIETIVDLAKTAAIDTLIESQFLPAALYPAMFRAPDGYHDFLLVCRCFEPLDFSDIVICKSLKPYLEQYSNGWRHTFMESFEVAND